MAATLTDETDRRLNLTVGLVVVLGTTTAGIALWLGISNGELRHPPWFRLLCVFAVLVLAGRFVLQVRIKASVHGMAMADAVAPPEPDTSR